MKPTLHVYPTSRGARLAFEAAIDRISKFYTDWTANYAQMQIGGPNLREWYDSASTPIDADKFKGYEYQKVYYYGPNSNIRAILLALER